MSVAQKNHELSMPLYGRCVDSSVQRRKGNSTVPPEARRRAPQGGCTGRGEVSEGLPRASLPRHKHDLTRARVDPRNLSTGEGYSCARIARFEGFGEQHALRPSKLVTMQFCRDRARLEGEPRGQ